MPEVEEITKDESDLYDLSDSELEQAYKSATRLEQPIDEPVQEDSNNDVDTEKDVDDEETQEDLDEDENTQTTESDKDDDPLENDTKDTQESADDEESIKESNQEVYRIKANGTEFDFSIDELKLLAPKAMDYTKKMQEIAPHRKSIEVMKSNNITLDDLNLFIEARNGSKGAIAKLMQSSNIDALDIDMDSGNTFTPKDYSPDDTQIAIRDIISKYGSEPEFKVTQEVVDTQWDSSSRQVLRNNPEFIELLHSDIKSGMYDQLSPIMAKLKALDNSVKSDIEYYELASKQYYANQQAKPVIQTPTVQETKARNEKRKVAALPKVNANKSVIDYLDEDNDENYDKWYKQVMSKV